MKKHTPKKFRGFRIGLRGIGISALKQKKYLTTAHQRASWAQLETLWTSKPLRSSPIWSDGLVVMVLAHERKGPGFESRTDHFWSPMVDPLQLNINVALKKQNGGKVTLPHQDGGGWPCPFLLLRLFPPRTIFFLAAWITTPQYPYIQPHNPLRPPHGLVRPLANGKPPW